MQRLIETFAPKFPELTPKQVKTRILAATRDPLWAEIANLERVEKEQTDELFFKLILLYLRS